MSDENATVRIVGDASGVAPATDKAKADIASLPEATKAATSQMKEHFAGVSVAVREMGVQVRETVAVIGELREVLVGFGEAMIAAFAIEKVADWAKEMGEAAEKNKHLSETFGMSVPEIQGLDAAAKATGLSVDVLTRAMGILDKNAVTASSGSGALANAFKAVGIGANDGKTQMERLLTIADKFKNMDDGPKKVALSMELFGRSGKEMIPWLNMGAEGLQKLDSKSQSYAAGVMFVTEANKELREWLTQVNEKGVELAESTNESKIAWQGLSNVLTDAFAPVLKEVVDGLNSMVQRFVQSYREGGTVRVVIDGIVNVLRYLWEIVKAVGEIFGEIFSAIVELTKEVAEDILDAFGVKTPSAMHASEVAWNVFKDVVVIAKDLILICIESIIAFIQELAGDLITLGKVAKDALTLNWGAIQSDWSSGLARVAKRVEETTRQVQAHAKEMQQAIAAAMHGDALGGKGGGVAEPPATKNTFNPTLGGTKKGKKGKEGDVVSEWDAELTAQKTAFAMQQDAQGTHEKFSLATEVQFWRSKINQTKEGTKDRLEVEKKYLQAQEALVREGNQRALEAIRSQEQMELERARSAAEIGKLDIQRQIDAVDAAEKLGTISATQAITRKAALNQQLIALDIQLENAEFRAKVAGLNAQLAQEKLSKDEQDKINKQLELAKAQHENKMVELHRKANNQQNKDDEDLKQKQLSRFQQMAKGWSDAIGKMVTGQQTFFQALQSGWQGMLNVISNAISQMVEQWIMGLITKDAATKASSAKTVLHSAKDAAAGAYAAVVKIPVIGPILAPPAAAAAFAGVMAFGSAEGGDWNVTPGMYELHKQEMVLPAGPANWLRGMMDSTSGSGGAFSRSAANDSGKSAAQGDSHLHYSPTIHGSTPKSLDQMLREEGDAMHEWFGRAVRNGQIKIQPGG